MPYRSDDSRFPLVVDETTGLVTLDELGRYIDQHDGYLARETPYAAVLHIGPGSTMRAPERRAMSEWLRRQKDQLATHHLAVGIAVESFLVRAMIIAVYKLAPPGYPYRVFDDVTSATRWVEGVLDRAGLDVPAASPVSSDGPT